MGGRMTDQSEARTLVRTTFSDEGIACVQMQDDPGKNGFSEAFVAELRHQLEGVATDPAVKVVVLTGLPDVFAAGAPKELLRKLAQGQILPSDILLSKALLDVPVPTISAMEGHATGGGLALGICADIVIIARESRYGASFMNLGFTPGMGTTKLLEHVLSRAVAHELMYTGEYRRGSEFAGRSGVNHIVPKADVRTKAFDVAAQIADKPRVALETLKRALSVGRRQAFEQSRTLETMMHEITFSQDEILRRIEESYVE